ncbi:Protein of unknown function [Streptacidiphilus jiangxiensis]|uniref:Thoeris anti-defense 2-like domain-containing protein n=2 Tax=Streptacidiphilus jiangxiensis TaxID=235985 RepID=A0A1H7WFR8_STRJI|nr:Protein of unknown function [Streptacidiphilus jiangxiensis]
MSFGAVLRALRSGQRCARLSWTLPGKYIVLVGGADADPAAGLPRIDPFIGFLEADGTFAPYAPSSRALLARDWYVGVSGQYADRA